jgi:hypothetical protein
LAAPDGAFAPGDRLGLSAGGVMLLRVASMHVVALVSPDIARTVGIGVSASICSAWRCSR